MQVGPRSCQCFHRANAALAHCYVERSASKEVVAVKCFYRPRCGTKVFCKETNAVARPLPSDTGASIRENMEALPSKDIRLSFIEDMHGHGGQSYEVLRRKHLTTTSRGWKCEGNISTSYDIVQLLHEVLLTLK